MHSVVCGFYFFTVAFSFGIANSTNLKVDTYQCLRYSFSEAKITANILARHVCSCEQTHLCVMFHVSEMVFKFYQGAGIWCRLDHHPLEDGSRPRQWRMSSYLHINCFKAASVLRSGMLFCRQTSSGYLTNSRILKKVATYCHMFQCSVKLSSSRQST